MSENVPNPGRRAFAKTVVLIGGGLVGAAAMAKKVSGNYDASVEVPEQSREIGLSPEKMEELYSGKIEKDENLTTAIERISGRKMKDWGTLELVWKNPNTNCDYHFKDKQSFEYQGIVPLPMVQPGDEIIFGTKEDMEGKLVEPGVLTSKGRVDLESGIKGADAARETHLTVFGGRFDRTVFYLLNNEGDTWKIHFRGNEWVDSKKFKDLMDANPDMKSSEALSQL